MPIEYTNQPVRLKITAELEFEDGQSFTFDRETTDFTEDDETVSSYFDAVSTEVYDKLDEFSIESEEEDWEDEGWEDEVETILKEDAEDDYDTGYAGH